MSKIRDIAGRLPDFLKHPVGLTAGALLGITLVTVPTMQIAAMKAADRDSGASIELTATAPEPAEPAPAAVAPSQTTPAKAAAPDGPAAAPSSELIAFYANFDEEGLKSLERNAKDIDVLVPMWYHLGSNGRLTYDSAHAERVMRIIKAQNPDMKVMPIVNNYDKATESWNAPQVGQMISTPAGRTQVAQTIVTTISKAGYDGVNIDFESFTEKDRANLVAFMAELYPLAKKAGLEVSMDVIVLSRTYDHANLAKHVDYLIPMMYDEHWKTSPAGPISSVPWFEKTLKRFLEQVPAEKVMVGMGTYSYDWGAPGARAKSLTWQKAAALAAQYGVRVPLDPNQLNSSFSYSADGVTHSVWMQDAMSGFNQMSVASRYGVRGYAIWRLGSEDPALWKVLPHRDALDSGVAESLTTGGRTVTYDEGRRLITEGMAQY